VSRRIREAGKLANVQATQKLHMVFSGLYFPRPLVLWSWGNTKL